MSLESDVRHNLVVTHYDVLKATEPVLFECVRQDLRYIEKHGLDGPFSNVDDFKGYQRYAQHALQEHIADIKGQMRKRYGNNTFAIESAFQAYIQGQQIRQFGYMMHKNYFVILNFELFGKKTFFFADNLVEHLALTNLEAPSEFLTLPFPSALFVYNAEIVKRAITSTNSKIEVDLETPVSVFISEHPSELGDRKIIILAYQSSFKRFTSLIKRELLIKENWKISDTLRTDWGDVYHGETVDDFITDDDSIFFETEILNLFRVVINSLLYLQSNDPEILSELTPSRPPRIERNKDKSKITQDHSSLTYSSVGDSIQPIIIERTTPADDAADSGQKKRELSKRFVVRGHWRNQPFGEGFQKRKLIWIKPFHKGPDMGEMIERPYVVK